MRGGFAGRYARYLLPGVLFQSHAGRGRRSTGAAGNTMVVLCTLVETATGMVHAITDRVDVGLEAAGRRRLTPPQSALLTVAILAAAVAMAQFGIIALVAQGYSPMAYGFIPLFALPLLSVGLYRIIRASPTGTTDPSDEADGPASARSGAR